MREFWDARAEENAMFFVDNRLDYRDTDAELFWRRGEEDLERVLGELDVTIAADAHVVDLGCGIGRLTRPLAKRARHVTAIDISERMLAQAREANPELQANVTWLHGDGTTLKGIDDESVDGVFSWVVLQHVPEPEIVLGYVEEMGRVLKPGGWAAFQVSTDPTVHRPRGIAERAKQALGKGPKGQADPAWLGTAVDPADLRATVSTSGLRVRRLLNEGSQFCLVHAVKEFAKLPIT